MTSTVLIPRVRLRIFRHYSALAGARACSPTITTASSASQKCHLSRRFSSSALRPPLGALFPRWKERYQNSARDDQRDWSSIHQGRLQDVNAVQRLESATHVDAHRSSDVASSLKGSATIRDENESVVAAASGFYDDHSWGDRSKVCDDADAYEEAYDPSLEAGDPFDCDHIDMRVAKARSKYAWVSGMELKCRFLLSRASFLDYMRNRV